VNNIKLPSGLHAKDQRTYDLLSMLTGPAFDRAYARDMEIAARVCQPIQTEDDEHGELANQAERFIANCLEFQAVAEQMRERNIRIVRQYKFCKLSNVVWEGVGSPPEWSSEHETMTQGQSQADSRTSCIISESWIDYSKAAFTSLRFPLLGKAVEERPAARPPQYPQHGQQRVKRPPNTRKTRCTKRKLLAENPMAGIQKPARERLTRTGITRDIRPSP